MRFSFALIPLFLLSACAMQNNSYVSNEPMQVKSEDVVHEMPANNASRNRLNEIVDDIKRRADSDVSITVHYDLKKPLHGTQKLAEAQGNRLKGYLQQQGVRHRILVLAEPDREEDIAANNIVISYRALKAEGPANCMDITHADADRYDHGTDSGYYYGCTGDRYLSEMIARPGDLLGNDTTTAAESQRLNKSLDTYRAGERATRPEDEGVSASNVYDSN